MTANELFCFLCDEKWDDLSHEEQEIVVRVITASNAEGDAMNDAWDRFERLDIPLKNFHCHRVADARVEREDAEAEMIRCLGHLWGKK